MKISLIISFLLLCLSGCGPKTYFDPIENGEQQYVSRPKGCTIEMLLYDVPSDKQYDEMGICTGSYQAYSGKSFDTVIRAIKDCACEIGGNAIIYSNENDTYTYDYLGQVTRFKTSAIVLYLHETDYLHEFDVPEIENIDKEFEEEYEWEEDE
ncbi:uncharacterized protein METZ01_LOCUS460167 [marine metagenome]|uniref:Uncharacterized protein n=1 Tax=marine metagenome TaxID=408172 RepID=A0A383AIB0_9ZZZZ